MMSQSNVEDRVRMYDRVVAKANAARVCPNKHACERYDFVMTEFYGNGVGEDRFMVRIPYTGNDCAEEWEEVFFADTRKECEDYIRTSDLQNAGHRLPAQRY